MNALARASRETMVVQKYREACAQARAALRPLTYSERRAIVLQVDDILGVSHESDDFPSTSSLAPACEPIPNS